MYTREVIVDYLVLQEIYQIRFQNGWSLISNITFFAANFRVNVPALHFNIVKI